MTAVEKTDPISPAEQIERTERVGTSAAVRIAAEVGLLIWAMAVLGYFYYTRSFHLLIWQIWEKFIG